MSGFGDNDDGGVARFTLGATPSTNLLNLLSAEDIQPGSAPSYSLCKTIYSYHPLGAKLAEKPINVALSQARLLEVPGGPEEDLIAAFNAEWNKTGGVGANTLIKNVMALSRVYGIAAVAAVCPDIPADQPLPYADLAKLELRYNILDPLNTAGSLVLQQDPNSQDFQKPTNISVAGKPYHSSRAAIVMNEMPIYIEWTSSAYGFVGRSVYQRALYPMKSYVQSMITDQAVTEKAALLIMKMKSPGSIVDQRTRGFFNFKRQVLKGAKTGNVVSMGVEESAESLDLKNVRDAAEFARNNILKNIASANNMPASMINDETLAEGFGEGSEDAKQIAGYIDGIRMEMNPVFGFFDNIVMRRAWNEDFYKSMQRKHTDLKNVPFDTAFTDWKNAFKATWPNLLTEPDSEKVKVDDIITKAAIASVEVLAPLCDPENKATLVGWLADVLNDRDLMFSSPLVLDTDLIASYVPPVPTMGDGKEPEPIPESSHE